MHSTDSTPFSPRDDYSKPVDDDIQTTSKETTETDKVPTNTKADTEKPDITEIKELPDLSFVGEELGTQTDHTKSTESKILHALVNPPIDFDTVLTDPDGTPIQPDPKLPEEIAGAQLGATEEALGEAAKTTSKILSEETP